MASKVRVYGKAQNRTALGIVKAYLVMYPHATFDDLKKAFPSALNQPAMKAFKFSELFITTEQHNARGENAHQCCFLDDKIVLQDGTELLLVMLWQKPEFEAIVAHAKQYDIEVADFQPKEGFRKGGYTLEYLNGYTPPAPAKKKSLLWLIVLLLLLLLGLLSFLFMRPKQTETKVVTETVVVRDTVLVYVEQVQQIQAKFNNIQYAVGKAVLSDDAKEALIELVYVLRNYPETTLKVIGHTSVEGSATSNQKLSEDRAKCVIDYIASKGIDASRLSYEGKGSSELIDIDNHEANRRTEFIISK